MDNIRGKTIAITGAARGIGYATAKALLARGARVVIGDRDVALQESAVAGLAKLGPVSGLCRTAVSASCIRATMPSTIDT